MAAGPGGVVPHISPGVRVGMPRAPVAAKLPVGKPAKPARAPAPHQRIAAAVQHLGGPRIRPWTEMSPGELKHFATKTVQQSTKTELEPFRRRAGEISGQEQNVASRYGAYGRATDTLLGGIQGEAGGSARTFENQVAQNALNASKGIETSGQELANQAAGSPQLAAQLQAERANVTGIGAAQQGAAGQLGQSESNFMTNLRAAAAQKVAEGQGQIAGAFGKQRAENQAKESELLSRQPGAITKLLTELTQKQFTNRAAEAGLGIKQGQLNVAQQNATTKARAQSASERLGFAKLSGEERQRTINNRINEGKLKVSELNANDKAAYDRWKMSQGGGKGGTKFSSATATKFNADVGKVQSAIITAVKGNTHDQAALNAAWNELRAKNVDEHLIHAAMNKLRYGHYGARDREYMKSIGAER